MQYETEGDGELAPLSTARENLTTLVFDSICNAIVTKKLAPGMRLSEASLAKQLNVSKTPVRESLLRLENIGLVVAHRSQGLQVIEPSEDIILEAYEVRAGLESFAARMAADRANTSTGESLTKAAAGSLSCAEVLDENGRREWDRTFHSLVAEAAENPRLTVLIRDQYLLTWTLRQRDTRRAADGVECASQHVEIAKAISDGDGLAASEGMLEHLTMLRHLVLDAHREAEANSH